MSKAIHRPTPYGNVVETPRFVVYWHGLRYRRPDGRKRKVRHNRNVCSVYVQVGPLEVILWYRDVTRRG